MFPLCEPNGEGHRGRTLDCDVKSRNITDMEKQIHAETAVQGQRKCSSGLKVLVMLDILNSFHIENHCRPAAEV